MLIFFGIGGIWTIIAPIEGAIHANGEVISLSKMVIQHFGGGVISKVLVKEGEKVEKNMPLILLRNINEKANLNLIKKKLLFLLANEARLLTITMKLNTIKFPNEIKKLSNSTFVKKITENQIELFNSQHQNISGKINIFQQRIKQLQYNLIGVNSKLYSVRKRFDLIYEELKTKKQFFNRSSYTRKSDVFALKKQFAKIEGKIKYYRSIIFQIQEKIGENKLEILNLKNEIQEKSNIELKEVRMSIADLREKLIVAEDALARTIIRSPQSGIVSDVHYYTEGGIIESGIPIMSIIPFNENLIIYAKVKAKNIEEILSAQKKKTNIVIIDGLEGLKVKVRLSAYSIRNLSLINGIVNYISPDALDDRKLGRCYSVHVVIPKSELVQSKKNIYLYPGMPAEIYIVTQSRTLFSFLFTPIISVLDKSFIER